MYKTTLFSKISNTIFVIISSFIFSFIWINYITHSIKKSLISSIIITISIIIIYVIYNKINLKLNQNLKTQTSQLDNTKIQLLYNKDINHQLLKHYNITISTQISDNHYIDTCDRDIFFEFSCEQIDQISFAQLYKSSQFSNIIIFCINTPTLLIPANTEITFYDLHQIHQYINTNHINITNPIMLKTKQKPTLNDIKNSILSCKNSKKYFWFSFLLMFSSLFTPFKIYYIVIGSILMLLSIISRFHITTH